MNGFCDCIIKIDIKEIQIPKASHKIDGELTILFGVKDAALHKVIVLTLLARSII